VHRPQLVSCGPKGHTGLEHGKIQDEGTSELMACEAGGAADPPYIPPEAISIHDFSALLLWTWGQTRTMRDPDLGPYILRTGPSGGARHPSEVYPVVRRVEGIPPGIYHYSVQRHRLETLRLGKFEDLVVRLYANQDWCEMRLRCSL
jgi:hypothetical protein